MNDQPEMWVYIGTYTRTEPHVQGKAEGIYVYRMDPSTGELEYVTVARNVENPSYLAIEPQQRFLYAVNEIGDYAGQETGAITAFAIDAQTGGLTPLNQQATHGTAPCYVCVDQGSRYALVANYGTGSACVLPIQADGRLGAATDVVQHQGSSVNPQRQAGPHAHSINLDPANRYAFVADLGLDKVMIYQFDTAAGKLKPHVQPWVQVQPGAGPRHLDFHPSARYAYLINEMDSTMTVFAYQAAKGTLQPLQTISTLPADFTGRNSTADVHVHPGGRFVYGSNRGHNSIVIFEIDETSGTLTLVGHESTQGETPRNFVIDPTGTFLLAANQNSDTVVSFRIDSETGRLSPTGHVAEVPTPVCLKFLVR